MGARIRVTLAILATVLAAACSSSGSGGSGGPAGSTPDNGSLSANALAARTIAAFKSASAMHVFGTFDTGSGSGNVDLHLGDAGAQGSLDLSGSTVQILAVGGSVYFKAPDAFYRQFVPAAQQASVIPLMSGKWLKIPAGNNAFSDLANFGSKKAFVSAVLANSGKTKTYVKGPSKTIDGQATVSFTDPKQHTTIYVPRTGTPYPVQVQASGASSLRFDSWNKPVDVSAPPANQVFDLSQFMH